MSRPEDTHIANKWSQGLLSQGLQLSFRRFRWFTKSSSIYISKRRDYRSIWRCTSSWLFSSRWASFSFSLSSSFSMHYY